MINARWVNLFQINTPTQRAGVNHSHERNRSAMKHILCAVALLLSTVGFAFGQTAEPKQEEKATTLEETIKWISQNLPALAGYETKEAGKTAVVGRVVSVTFDGYSGALSTRDNIE